MGSHISKKENTLNKALPQPNRVITIKSDAAGGRSKRKRDEEDNDSVDSNAAVIASDSRRVAPRTVAIKGVCRFCKKEVTCKDSRIKSEDGTYVHEKCHNNSKTCAFCEKILLKGDLKYTSSDGSPCHMACKYGFVAGECLGCDKRVLPCELVIYQDNDARWVWHRACHREHNIVDWTEGNPRCAECGKLCSYGDDKVLTPSRSAYHEECYKAAFRRRRHEKVFVKDKIMDMCGRCHSGIFTFQDNVKDREDGCFVHTACNLQMEIRRFIVDTAVDSNKNPAEVLEAFLCAGNDSLIESYKDKENMKKTIAESGCDNDPCKKKAIKALDDWIDNVGYSWIRRHLQYRSRHTSSK